MSEHDTQHDGDAELHPLLERYREAILLLGQRKIFLLNCLAESASNIKLHQRPKGKSLWEFYFDDGVFKGGHTFSLRQDEIRPLFVAVSLIGIPWPGLKALRTPLDEAALGILEKKYAKWAGSNANNDTPFTRIASQYLECDTALREAREEIERMRAELQRRDIAERARIMAWLKNEGNVIARESIQTALSEGITTARDLAACALAEIVHAIARSEYADRGEHNPANPAREEKNGG